MFLAANALITSSAFFVLFRCSSSIITTNSVPSLCASAIFSNKLERSLSFNAVFPFFVTSSQLIKVTLPGSNPAIIEYIRFLVSICGAKSSILSLLCSSRFPFPGHSHTNAVFLLVFFRNASTYLIRMIVFPAPVGAFTVITCLLLVSTVLSIRYSTHCV